MQNVKLEKLIVCNSYSVKQETRFGKCVRHFVNFGPNPRKKLFPNPSMEYVISEWIVVTRLLTLYIAAIIKALSLLGSPRDGQAALFHFQKHLLSWKCTHSFDYCGRFWKQILKARWCLRRAFHITSLTPHPRATINKWPVASVHFIPLISQQCSVKHLKLAFHDTHAVRHGSGG